MSDPVGSSSSARVLDQAGCSDGTRTESDQLSSGRDCERHRWIGQNHTPHPNQQSGGACNLHAKRCGKAWKLHKESRWNYNVVCSMPATYTCAKAWKLHKESRWNYNVVCSMHSPRKCEMKPSRTLETLRFQTLRENGLASALPCDRCPSPTGYTRVLAAHHPPTVYPGNKSHQYLFRSSEIQ